MLLVPGLEPTELVKIEGEKEEYSEAVLFLKEECAFGDCHGALCTKLRIHTDPWV